MYPQVKKILCLHKICWNFAPFLGGFFFSCYTGKSLHKIWWISTYATCTVYPLSLLPLRGTIGAWKEESYFNKNFTPLHFVSVISFISPWLLLWNLEFSGKKDSKTVRRKESRFRGHLNLRHILLPCLEKFRLSSLTINSTFIHKLQNLIRFNLCCLCLHSLVDSKTVATALFLGVDIYHFSWKL